MEYIKTLIAKSDWKNKLQDPTIQQKWGNEFIKQGADKRVVDKAIQLLLHSLNLTEYDDDADFKWILPISTNLKDIGLQCDHHCTCLICNDGDKENINYKEEFKICTCYTVHNLNSIKQAYLEHFIIVEKMPINIKKEIIQCVTVLQQQHPTKDYHPWTNNTVIDIIHPSLYCYVDGITKLNKSISLPKSVFQWLPAEFSLDSNTFTSPIHLMFQEYNHKKLYQCLNSIFTLFLPKFQHILAQLYHFKKVRKPIYLQDYKNLQVIVKIGSTELTTESNKSNGTDWHLEGIQQENIIATGIYYYDITSNIKSTLRFRTVVEDVYDIDYPQFDTEYVKYHYGMESHDTNNMPTDIPLGSISTTDNTSLCFPNFLQHKVDSFHLTNHKNGHRSILVFFLIDPRIKIPSTNDVITNQMTLEEAIAFRELLMFERKYETTDQNNFYQRGWSLCEH